MRSNIFLYGDAGVGKSFLLKDLPGKVFVYSLDPYGYDASVFKEAENRFTINRTFEGSFDLDAFERHLTTNAKELKTYDFIVLDSITLFIEGVKSKYRELTSIAEVQVKSNTIIDIPVQYYAYLLAKLTKVIDILNSYTNFICVAHAKFTYDKEGKATEIAPAIPGQARTAVLARFSEVYYYAFEGRNRTLATSGSGLFMARKKVGHGKVDDYIKTPDMASIIKQLGVVLKT